MNVNKQMLEDAFGNCDKDNADKLVEYISVLSTHISHKMDYKYPFLGGDGKLNYDSYLRGSSLNMERMLPVQCFEYIDKMFQNVPNWHNPGTMINVIPPVNLVADACADYIGMYNPNFAQDTYAGNLIIFELEVVKYISDLIGWDWERSGGVFTFGGKGTNLYATKIALGKADANSSKKGCYGKKYFMLTSKNAHPCHIQVCDWIGIGSDNCIEIACEKNGTIDLRDLDKKIRHYLDNGFIFLGINLNGGSTNELVIDPVKPVCEIIDQVIDDYSLQYRPHIHIDSVLGWAFSFFINYDFQNNPHGIDDKAITVIKEITSRVLEFKYADSIGVDFHKMGFCEYSSSLFAVKNKIDFAKISKNKTVTTDNLKYGEYNPYEFTLELSRSSRGAVSALVGLKSLGIKGFQQIIANWVEVTQFFKSKLDEYSGFCVHDKEAVGFATLFSILPYEWLGMVEDELKKLDESKIKGIKELNNGFSAYLLLLSRKHVIDFYFPSSRSYKITNTDIVIGALKAYPTSIYLSKNKVESVIKELCKLRLDFLSGSDIRIGDTIRDGMVYER